MPRRRTTQLIALVVLVALLVAAGVILATRDGTSPTSARYAASDYAQPGWNGHPQERIRPAEELWSGDVSLVLDRPYGLDERPGKLVEPCGGCLMLETLSAGEVALRAENGIVRWPKANKPSYYECVHLREAGTEDYVVIAASQGASLPIHAWMCATGRKDDIVRLRYEGPGGGGYRFDVTTWHRPFID